jgi:DNA-binding response OmpR family regulator
MIRILIVDDDDMLRSSLAEILEEAGYEVAEAGNGVIALTTLRESAAFDIVLTDMRMPEMDGPTLLGELRSQYPDLAVIMMTGEGTIATAVQAMRDGAVNYLLKPTNKRQLLESVREAVNMRSGKMQQRALMDQVVSNLQALGLYNPNLQDALHQHTDVTPVSTKVDDRFLQVRDLMIDQHRLVAMFEGKLLELTPTEFEIVYCLVQAQGRVVTFEEIVFRLQGIRAERDEARTMLSTHLSNLRAKLREAGCEEYLVNSRGHGYYVNFD